MTRPKRTPRPVGLPAFIQRGIYRARRIEGGDGE